MTSNGVLDQVVGRYVAVRDQIKEMKATHAAEVKPLQDKLDKLGGLLDKYFQTTGVKNIGTESGTAYHYTKPAASLADPKAFMDHVIHTGGWALLDKRANANACIEFAKEHGGLPPGVNLNMNRKIGVRRPGEKEADND